MELEKRNSEKIRHTKIRLAVLTSLKVAGVLTVAVLAPNAVQYLLKPLTNSSINSSKSAIRRLRDAGFVTYTYKNKHTYVDITPRGEKYLQSFFLHATKPKHWDKQWRIVIFDIPKSRNQLRDKLRDVIRRIGFVKLQNSVWVYPYDCEEIVTLLKTHCHVGKEVLYMIVSTIESDKYLRRIFKLS